MSGAPFVLNFLSSIPSSPPCGQQTLRPKQVAPEESLAFILPTDSTNTGFKSHINQENRGLGTWFFDKKTRKRRYVSLLGKNFSGSTAVEQARQDKISELHPANSARAELRYLMTTMAPNRLDDLFNSVPSSLNESLPLFENDPLALAQWGVPLRVVNRYSALGINRMFPWQIECLGVDDGKVLRGGKTLFFAISSKLLFIPSLTHLTPLPSPLPLCTTVQIFISSIYFYDAVLF